MIMIHTTLTCGIILAKSNDNVPVLMWNNENEICTPNKGCML